MKHQLLAFLVFLFIGTPLFAVEETFKIDPVHSTVGFRIRHLGISWVSGNFREFSGMGYLNSEAPEKSRIEVTVQAKSVDTQNDDRDKHLCNEDFFNVAKFPTLTFKSTGVKKDSDMKYVVTGDLTMLGVTKPVTFTVEATEEVTGRKGEKRRGGETTFKIKRSDFGMNNSIGPIGDEVQISLAFSAIKQ